MRTTILLILGMMLVGLAGRSGALAANKAPEGPAVTVVVDLRVELLSILFRLAGNPEYNQGRVESYTKDVESHFGKFREHEAVKLARELRRTHGISYDACMSMAVHLSDDYELGERVPFAPRPTALDGRWMPADARKFRAAAKRFVEETSFKTFIENHRSLYDTAQSRMKALLEKEGHMEWFDRFFGARPQSRFIVELGLLNGGSCYGPHFRASDGKEELFCILGVWQTDKEGMPEFTRDMLSTVVHEFCHSYANPIIDRHDTELKAAGEQIFPHVAAALRRQAYDNWKTMFYESLVRASTLRYVRQHDGATAARLATQEEKRRGFPWIEDLAALLGEYEAHRDQYPTLESFSPRLVAFFGEYAKKQTELAAKQPKVVAMTPVNGQKGVDPNLAKIEVVFDRPMQDRSWSMVGGGPHFPEMTGKPSYDAKRMRWSVPVKLKPEWEYQFMLNSDRFQNFQSEAGVPLEPLSVHFVTGK
jgi:hypothetical protein